MRNIDAIRTGLFPLIAASLVLTGCGRSPSIVDTPRTTTGNNVSMLNQRPVLPAGVVPVALQMTPTNASIPVGDQRRFEIKIQGSNGQVYTDPRLVTWTIGDPQAGTIDDQGVFTPQSQRVTTVRATLMDKSVEAQITIVPATYTWQQVQSPTNADLYGVKMVSTKEAWAAGANGTVLHFLNGTWQTMNYPIPTSYTWRSVDFANPGNGWMVGHQGPEVEASTPAIAMAFRNGMWYPTPTNVTGALLGVSTVAENNAWAVGRDASGKSLILQWNGSSWVRNTSYSGRGQLNAIQMLGGSDGWAVGKEGGDALVLHWDGKTWSKISLPPFFGTLSSSELLGLQMLNGQQGYAVGKKVDALGVAHGLLMYYDGRSSNVINFSNWKEKDAASGTTRFLDQVPLRGIAMTDSNKGWLLGSTITPRRLEDPGSWFGGTINDVYGNLLKFNGTSYDVDSNFQSYSLSQDFMNIHLLPEGEGVIVGRKGYLMQRAYDWRGMNTQNPYAPQPGYTNTQPPSMN